MEQLALLIINALTLIVLGAGGFIVKNLFNRVEKIEVKQEEMQKEQHGMKLNYLDRFSDVKDHTTEQINKVLAAVNEIKFNCAALNHKQ